MATKLKQMFLKNQIKTIKLLFIFFLLLSQFQLIAQVAFKPAVFDGSYSQKYNWGQQLDYGDEGTIEIRFKVTPVRRGLRDFVSSRFEVGSIALLSLADEYNTRFTVFLNKTHTAIGIYDGETFKSVPVNFNNNNIHHVALSTKDGQTQIIVNGRNLFGPLTIGYGSAVNVPLYLGSSDGALHHFKGEIHNVRLWKEALTAADIRSLRFKNKIEDSEPLFANLVAYSDFTERDLDIFFAHPPIFKARIGNFSPDYTYSQHLLGEKEFYRAAVMTFQQLNVTDFPASLSGFRMFTQIESEDSLEHKIPIDLFKINGEESFFLFDKDEYITGLAGTMENGLVKSLRFITNKKEQILRKGSGSEGTNPFFVSLPQGTKLVGIEIANNPEITGVNNMTFVAGIGLLYTTSQPLETLSLGTWTIAGEEAPLLNDDIASHYHHRDLRDGALHTHGNYSTPSVYKLEMNLVLDEISVSGELPRIYSDSVGTAIGPYNFEKVDGTTYQNEEKQVQIMFSSAYEFELKVHPDTIFPMSAGTYDRSMPYEVGGKDKNEWGGTFTLNQKPTLSEFNFLGYNIARIHPQNYQLGTGTSKMVFEMPSESSYDYYVTNADKIVPHGLIYKNTREAMFRASTHMVSSASDYKAAWNVKLGFSVGFPGMSFGENIEHNEATDRMQKSEQQHSVTTAHETKYALVMDKTQMNLSDEFKNAVFTLRNNYLIRGAIPGDPNALFGIPDFMGFIEDFGTHYPYAVTYGGMAYQEVNYTNSELVTEHSQGTQIGAEASGTLEGITLGVSGGGGDSTDEKFTNVVSDKDAVAHTIGGDISFGGEGIGWTLPDHSEVPIYLDLRPISELLSPLYFEDELIYTTLRTILNDSLEAYENSFRTSDSSWVNIPDYRQFEIEFTSMSDTNPGDTDGYGEWVGTFSAILDTTTVVDSSFAVFQGTTSINTNNNNSLQTGKTLTINSRTNEYKISNNDYCNAQIRVSGQLEEIDAGFGNSNDEFDIDGIDILNISIFTTEWQTGTLIFKEIDGGEFDDHATINYRYREVIPEGGELIEIECPATAQ